MRVYNAKLCFLVTVCGKGCFLTRTLCVSAPVWSTEHYSTYNYGSVWSCPSETSARASILGFSTISLTKVWIKHLFKETRHDFNPRCVSLCFCLFCSIEVNCCIYYSVLLFKFVFVDLLLSLTIEATAILPVVLVWSVEDQAAVCTVGLCKRGHEPQTCWSNATGRAKSSNWQAARVNNKKFSVNHIRSHKHLHKVNISWMMKTSIIYLLSHQCPQRLQFFISGCRVSVACRRLDQALSKWQIIEQGSFCTWLE